MYEQLNQFFVILKDIVVVICPAVLAVFTYKSSKKEKEDKKYRALREQLDQERENKKKERDKNLNETITEMKDAINEVKKTVDGIDINDVEKQLNNLVQLNGINLEYSQSLSKVVVKMADCIRNSSVDQQTKADIAQAIEDHQNTEKALTNRIYKFIY